MIVGDDAEVALLETTETVTVETGNAEEDVGTVTVMKEEGVGEELCTMTVTTEGDIVGVGVED